MYFTRLIILIFILSVAIIGCGNNSDDKVSDVQKTDEQNQNNQNTSTQDSNTNETIPTGLAIYFNPSKLSSSKNSEFNVDISINNVIGLYGCYFDLVYDPKFLEVIEGSRGELLGSDILSLFHIEPGVINVGMTRKSRVQGVNGSGVVAHTKFKALASGKAEVKIVFKNNTALRTNEGKSVEGIEKITIRNLEVQIK